MAYKEIEKDAKEIANQITNYVNSYGRKSEDFNSAMSREHRTLQQNFTRLCLSWLEHCASDEYNFDARNESSHDISKVLIESFDKGGLPSQWLPSI